MLERGAGSANQSVDLPVSRISFFVLVRISTIPDYTVDIGLRIRVFFRINSTLLFDPIDDPFEIMFLIVISREVLF